jgi:predicted acyl esterase
MQSSIRMDRNVPMEMRDGIILRADIYRPDDGQKHPAVLLRTPYARFDRIRAIWNARLHPPVLDAEQEGDRRYEKVVVPCFHLSHRSMLAFCQ